MDLYLLVAGIPHAWFEPGIVGMNNEAREHYSGNT